MMNKKEQPKKKTNLEPKEIDDYEPGITKSQYFKALKIVSTPKEKPIEKPVQA